MATKKEIASLLALQRLKHLSRIQDYDALRPGSRPTPAQQNIINHLNHDAHKIFAVLGGNRCLAEGTLVATPKGAVPIEKLRVGDIVYDEAGQEQYVEAHYDMGIRKTIEVWTPGRYHFTCTPNHDIWVKERRQAPHKIKAEELPLEPGPQGIVMAHTYTPTMGPIHTTDAYLLGHDAASAALADTSRLHLVPSLSRRCLVEFLAGVIEVGGQVRKTEKVCNLQISAPTPEALFLISWAIQSLWQIPARQYKTNSILIRGQWAVAKILHSVNPFLASPIQQVLCMPRPTVLYGAYFKDFGQKHHVWDITVTGKNNVFLLADGSVVGNSGKSQLGRRILAWALKEDAESPWKRPPHWKGPLRFLYVGKSHKMLLGDFLPKFTPFFEEDELHIVKQAQSSLFSISHRDSKNEIFFFVHENPAECRERVQAFDAHMVFLDELPRGYGAMPLMEELQARTTDSKGYFIMTFTPKSVSPQVKKFVESLAPPLGRKYALNFLDNPGIDDEAKQLRLQAISTQTASYQKTLLEGDWMQEGNAVYILPDNLESLPQGYSPGWRHVASVDPGLSSICGLVVFAEEPSTGRWYVVKCKEIEKSKDSELAAKKVADELRGLNVVLHVYDAASDWWHASATRAGLTPLTHPYDKNHRREEMINNTQLSLGTRIFIAPWCENLVEELSTMAWSDKVEGKVVNSNIYHLADAFRYGVDCLPAPSKIQTEDKSWAQRLREGHKQRLDALEASKKHTNTLRPPPRNLHQIFNRRSRIWQ